jgi:tetratricopeptide (TPR) repeat protein
VADSYFGRGTTYYAVGEYVMAVADFTRTVELDPDLATAYNNLAWTLAYDLDTDYEEALKHVQRSVELGPNSYNHDTLALVYYKLEQYEKALEHYDIALKLDPEQAASCKGRGDVYLAIGDEVSALADYEMYLLMAPAGPEWDEVEQLVENLREP